MDGCLPALTVLMLADIAKSFQYFFQIFNSLLPYRRLLTEEHERFGYPPLRAMYLHYPHGNKAAVAMERLQYMLGPLLMIVPITTPGLQYLNQKITELPDDGEDDPEPEIFSEEDPSSDVLFTQGELMDLDENDMLTPRSVSSELMDDETDESMDESSAELNGLRNGRMVKARVMSQVRSWARTGAAQAIHLMMQLFQPSPTEDDILPGETLHMMSDGGSEAGSRRFFGLFGGKARGNGTAGKQAPPPKNPLPSPHHGRPYLPYGTWIHIWTGTRFNVTDPNGLYLTESMELAKLPCPIGKPGVFIREITDGNMRELIQQGMAFSGFGGAPPPKGGEDWRYWLDDLDSLQSAGFETLISRAMDKYRSMRGRLDTLLEFITKNSYPGKD